MAQKHLQPGKRHTITSKLVRGSCYSKQGAKYAETMSTHSTLLYPARKRVPDGTLVTQPRRPFPLVCVPGYVIPVHRHDEKKGE